MTGSVRRCGRWVASIAGLAFIGVASPALGWWGDGHAQLSQAAVLALPPEMPAFFRAGGQAVAHASFDPDLFKNRSVPQSAHGEHSEHYFDLELLGGRPIPHQRYDLVALAAELGQEPAKIGLAPYAVAEWTQRLAVAFAEHRKWPDHVLIQQKCLLYAGLAAHYAQDLCQPLHVTIHFDGRVPAAEGAPRSRIHEQVDSLVERLELSPAQMAQGLQVAAFDSLMGAILAQVEDSHALVDRVYELEAKLELVQDPEVRAFGRERAGRATAFTAALFLSAWEQSAAVRLPGWLERE